MQRPPFLVRPAGQLGNAIALLEAGAAALHYSEPSVAALLGLAQELLSLVKLGACSISSVHLAMSASAAH